MYSSNIIQYYMCIKLLFLGNYNIYYNWKRVYHYFTARTEDDFITAARLLSMSKLGNPLKTQVEDQGLDVRFSVASGWEPMSDAGILPNLLQLDDT